jgi:hypothetical protein
MGRLYLKIREHPKSRRQNNHEIRSLQSLPLVKEALPSLRCRDKKWGQTNEEL